MEIKLQHEFEYYLKHQSELVKKYRGKWLAIKGDDVIGAYETQKEALDSTSRSNELGTFLIQLCVEGNSAYTQTFHSRVSFA